MKDMILRNEKGFALLAALIASLILLAVGMLVINMSAGDLISSSMSVGNKKASIAVESGIFKLMAGFAPANANGYFACTGTDTAATIPGSAWQTASNTDADSNTKYVICNVTSDSTKSSVYLPYYGTKFGLQRYYTTVIGENSSYNSLMKVNVGVGYFAPNY
jgi:Tfp pilus assembly protein PilV